MRTKISVALMLMIIGISSICYASSADRWEWITSTDTLDFYFDKETIQYGIVEEWDSSSHRFKNVIDRSKIIVYLKELYTDSYREQAAESARNKGLHDYVDEIMNTEYRIDKYEIDYKGKQMRLADSAMYDVNGKVLFSYNLKYADWSSIIPGSNGELIAKIVREYAEKNYEKVAKQTL